MTEKDTELSRRLVVGHKRDGRCCYDKEAKRELIEKCLQPGVSVARMALRHGINANLLRTWITQYQRRQKSLLSTNSSVKTEGIVPAFIPIVTPPVPLAATDQRELRLDITLDNGIQADLRCLSRDDVLALLPVLAGLPCSVSSRR